MNFLAEAATTVSEHGEGVNWEMLIVLTNIGLVLVSLALVVVTAMDNNAMVKIVQILAGRKNKNDSCGKHSHKYVSEHSEEKSTD